MQHWLKRLLGRSSTQPTWETDRLLALEQEAQHLRLELDDRDRTLKTLTQELERHQRSQDERIAESVQGQIESLLRDAATPIAQLLTQAHLIEVEGKPVPAKDVLSVARRLIRILEDVGLEQQGTVGQTVSFDPNRHEPLSQDAALTVGQPAVVRFVGLAYRGKILRKAGVEQLRE
jgi:molecular chaperone GrpE (heat shock protein)